MKVHVQITCVVEVPTLTLPNDTLSHDIITHGVGVIGATGIYPGFSVKIVEVNPRADFGIKQRRVQLGRRRSATRRRG